MITLILNSMEGPIQLILAQSKPETTELGNMAIMDSMCWEPQGQGAETLIPNLSTLLEKNELTPSSISRIACVRGPGSFTGIRLALTTALGLSRSIPGNPTLAGLDYLPLLASSASLNYRIPPTASIWIITHARRGQVHMQGFDAKCPLHCITPAQGCRLDDVITVIKEKSPEYTQIYLLGSGLSRNQEYFVEALPEAILLEESISPSLQSLLEAAENASYSDKPIEALYLRASDAEENLPYIAAGLGLDPHQAMLDLLKLTGRNA